MGLKLIFSRRNGIRQLLTRPYSPTTTSKVERWHQTLQDEFLDGAGPFASIEEAQAAVDEWREEYNHRRPHQSLDMACPADKFRSSAAADDGLALWAPADLEPVSTAVPGPAAEPAAADPASWPEAIETERIVPASGNMTVGPQQFWLGTSRTGQSVSLWIDTTTVHMSIGGWRIKTVPSRLSDVDLARLRNAGARPAGRPPAGPVPGALAATSCVEVQRLVNATGIITLGNQVIQVGSPLAGQRARIRLDGQVMHVITQDGALWRTLPCPIQPGQRHKLQGVRLAGPEPLPPRAQTVQRKVSSRGGIQVAGQRIQVGFGHAGQTVTIQLEATTLRIIDQHSELITTVPRNSTCRRPRVYLIATEAGDHGQRWRCINIRPGRLTARPWSGSPTVRTLLITARRAAVLRDHSLEADHDVGRPDLGIRTQQGSGGTRPEGRSGLYCPVGERAGDGGCAT